MFVINYGSYDTSACLSGSVPPSSGNESSERNTSSGSRSSTGKDETLGKKLLATCNNGALLHNSNNKKL